MRGTHARTALLLAVTLALAACASSGPSLGPTGALPETTRVLTAGSDAKPASPAAAGRAAAKIAVLLPLTGAGQTALIADTMKRAGELALFEQNGTGVQLVVKDDKGTPEGAKIAADEAVKAGAELVIGPLFSKSVTAAQPVLQAAKTQMLAFSTDRQVAGRGVLLLSHLPEADVQRIIGYASSVGKKRIAALIPDDAFGQAVAAHLTSAAQRAGATVVSVETYSGVVGSMIEALQKTHSAMVRAADEGAPVDALFLPGGEETLTVLSPLLKQANIDPALIKILGTGGLDYPHAGRNPQLIGAWFPGPDPRGWRDFSEKYAKAYGLSPPRIASLAYDAVSIAIALSGGADGQRYSAEALTRPTGFTGVDGAIRFAADGTPERALAVLEVQSFGANIIDQAPPLGSAQVAARQAAPAVLATRPNGLTGNGN